MAAGDGMTADSQIEVVLQRSGLTFIVPPDKSILQVLIEEGIDPMYDCQRGECGICQVAVLEGVPDHRDHILSDDERAGVARGSGKGVDIGERPPPDRKEPAIGVALGLTREHFRECALGWREELRQLGRAITLSARWH